MRTTANVRIVPITPKKMMTYRSFPNGFQLTSIFGMRPTDDIASPSPLPAVGFFKNGSLFGSSYASPTGSWFASSINMISIENMSKPW